MREPRILGLAALTLLLSVLSGCDRDGPNSGGRTWFMGFSALPPSPDPAQQLPTLTKSAAHSDAGLIQLSIPWRLLK